MNEEFSVAEDLSSNVTVDVTEEQVVKHLQDNPEFFLNHPELLSNMRLPHDSGEAISLVEKQVNILREQGVKATEKLKDLTDNARANDEIFDITRSLILDLLECNTIEKVINSVQNLFTGTQELEVDFSLIDRFYTDRPKNEKFGNHSGLGLSISKQIVEAHGGTIEASNRLNQKNECLGGSVKVTFSEIKT